MITTIEGRRFIRMEELMRKVGKSRAGIYDAIRRGDFPPPVRIGLRSSGWISEEVDQWMAKKVAESRGVEAA